MPFSHRALHPSPHLQIPSTTRLPTRHKMKLPSALAIAAATVSAANQLAVTHGPPLQTSRSAVTTTSVLDTEQSGQPSSTSQAYREMLDTTITLHNGRTVTRMAEAPTTLVTVTTTMTSSNDASPFVAGLGPRMLYCEDLQPWPKGAGRGPACMPGPKPTKRDIAAASTSSTRPLPLTLMRRCEGDRPRPHYFGIGPACPILPEDDTIVESTSSSRPRASVYLSRGHYVPLPKFTDTGPVHSPKPKPKPMQNDTAAETTRTSYPLTTRVPELPWEAKPYCEDYHRPKLGANDMVCIEKPKSKATENDTAAEPTITFNPVTTWVSEPPSHTKPYCEDYPGPDAIFHYRVAIDKSTPMENDTAAETTQSSEPLAMLESKPPYRPERNSEDLQPRPKHGVHNPHCVPRPKPEENDTAADRWNPRKPPGNLRPTVPSTPTQ